MTHDWILSIVAHRAAALRLTPYAIAKATNGQVSDDAIRLYLRGEYSLGSNKLQHVLRALGLTVMLDPASLQKPAPPTPRRHASPAT